VRISVLNDRHVRVVEVDPLPLTLHQGIVVPVGHALALMNDKAFQVVNLRAVLLVHSKFLWKRYLIRQLLMLPSLRIYLEPFEMDH